MKTHTTIYYLNLSNHNRIGASLAWTRPWHHHNFLLRNRIHIQHLSFSMLSSYLSRVNECVCVRPGQRYHHQAYMDQLNNEDLVDPNEHGRSGWIWNALMTQNKVDAQQGFTLQDARLCIEAKTSCVLCCVRSLELYKSLSCPWLSISFSELRKTVSISGLLRTAGRGKPEPKTLFRTHLLCSRLQHPRRSENASQILFYLPEISEP